MKLLGCFFLLIFGGIFILLALARNFLAMFFGNTRTANKSKSSETSQQSSSSAASSPNSDKEFKADEGEYVDYEEVKDDKNNS